MELFKSQLYIFAILLIFAYFVNAVSIFIIIKQLGTICISTGIKKYKTKKKQITLACVLEINLTEYFELGILPKIWTENDPVTLNKLTETKHATKDI